MERLAKTLGDQEPGRGLPDEVNLTEQMAVSSRETNTVGQWQIPFYKPPHGTIRWTPSNSAD